MYHIFCGTDSTGSIYATGALELATCETLEGARKAVIACIIDGVRGPGCFTISDDGGNSWYPSGDRLLGKSGIELIPV